MKKSIRKPENWQDFETLCKMLWGEIWGIPDKIKKNGRLGQTQFGVDVYGVPKGRTNYSGIQCKGKDDYTNSTLTKKEIDEEIEKATKIEPALDTFIFATTANKNAKIEAYIRKKDLESRNTGGFEILIFCWEDIADLIETHRDTFNYYVLDNQFKSKYELSISFLDGSDVFTVRPKFKKRITKYKQVNDNTSYFPLNFPLTQYLNSEGRLQPAWSHGIKNINHSWINFGIKFSNTGSMVFEDFKLYIYPEEGKFRNLSGYSGGVAEKLFYLKNSPLYVFDDDKYAIYRFKDNSPLIQKDGRSFDLYLLPMLEKYQMKISYEFLARDYNQEGELTLIIDPEYEIEENTIQVRMSDEPMENEVVIEDITSSGPLF